VPDAIAISKDDPRFANEVDEVLQAKLPHIVKLERYLNWAVAVWTILGGIGLLGVAGWGASIVFKKLQDESVDTAVKTRLAEPTGPVAKIAARMSNMSKTLNSTFETQVDSASFKVLKFGCTLPKAPPMPGVRPCAGPSLPEALLIEERSVSFVASPGKQTVQLDIQLIPGSTADLEPLLLEIRAQSAPTAPESSGSGTGHLLMLKPAQLMVGKQYLQDGRLRLHSVTSIWSVSIDLTPSLQPLELDRATQLRFIVVREVPAQGAGSSGPPKYAQTRDLDVFLLRTVTSAYHRIPQDEAVQ